MCASTLRNSVCKSSHEATHQRCVSHETQALGKLKLRRCLPCIEPGTTALDELVGGGIHSPTCFDHGLVRHIQHGCTAKSMGNSGQLYQLWRTQRLCPGCPLPAVQALQKQMRLPFRCVWQWQPSRHPAVHVNFAVVTILCVKFCCVSCWCAGESILEYTGSMLQVQPVRSE